MEIKFLKNEPIDKIVTVFNEAFSDYLVKVEVTPQSLAVKMLQESIDLNWSTGVYISGELVGFILNGYRDGILYNAGTGVIPEQRGQHFTQKMYEYLLPIANEKQINKLMLEVIKQNEKAFHVYKKLGFTIQRELISYKGQLRKIEVNSKFTIQQLKDIPEQKDWWNADPSWPGATASLQNIKDNLLLAGAYEKDALVGYVAVLKANGRLFQISVHPDYKRRKIASSLLHYAFKETDAPTMLALNLQSTDSATSDFFQSLGWQKAVVQYEMHLQL